MFRPWVGSAWGRPGNALGGVRLLVVGESHYCDAAEDVGTSDAGTTPWVVQTYALDGPHRFFTNVSQVVGGRPKWRMLQTELAELWHALAFYNYVPVFVANEARVRPSAEMFEAGAAPFQALLTELDPDAILVCGYELWWWLLNGLGDFAGEPSQTPYKPIGRALAGRMKHPSAGFNWSSWRPVVERLLGSALPGEPNSERPLPACGPASELDQLARELWEAHATHHQQVIPFPQEHWDQLDPFSQDHWRYIARAALAFRPAAAD